MNHKGSDPHHSLNDAISQKAESDPKGSLSYSTMNGNRIKDGLLYIPYASRKKHGVLAGERMPAGT
jgi:hypothetical protein